jgi:hypothetical protein
MAVCPAAVSCSSHNHGMTRMGDREGLMGRKGPCEQRHRKQNGSSWGQAGVQSPALPLTTCEISSK